MTSPAHPPTPAAAVVVCTHNRADRLAFCLTSLATQTLPVTAWELLVVDDGSTDATPAVCARFSHLKNLRVIRQPNAGLGASRERGWRASTAPVIAFLDDDAEATPDWLARIVENFSAAAPAAACLGGPARANWETPPPPWLDASLALWLTVWEPFAERRESADEHLFVGANMAFRRTALEAVNGFNSTLGRRGTSLLSHEESDLWSRLRAAGYRTRYDPQLCVKHFVPAARMTRAWFRRRLWWEGRSLARRQEASPRPVAALRMILGSLFSRPVLAHLAHPTRWGRSLAWQCHLAYKFGYATELLRISPPRA